MAESFHRRQVASRIARRIIRAFFLLVGGGTVLTFTLVVLPYLTYRFFV